VLVYVIVIIVAPLIPAVTRGSYTRLLDVSWRFRSLLFAGLAIQITLEYVTIPRAHWHDWGFGLLVASYVLILAFAARNLVLRGMGIVLIGIACNALVISLNQGMPFKVPVEWQHESWTKPTVKHHPQQPDDKLRFLSDIIVLKSPLDSVISFGDLILAVGLCDVAYNVSRKPRRRGGRSSRRARSKGADADNVGAERTGQGRSRSQMVDLTGPDRDEPGGSRAHDLALTRSRSTRSSATTTRSS
jgi:hypothetical protein